MTLTQAQIAQCARVVQPHGDYGSDDMRWVQHISGNVYLYKEGETFSSYAIWAPGFADNENRSQALAVIEWIIKNGGTSYAMTVASHIQNGDIHSLQALVLELSEKS